MKQMVRDFGVNRISFYDDLMIADLGRLEKIVELINRDKSLSRLRFKLNARANLVNEKTAYLLSKMRVDSVGMGLESGNERTLRYLKSGSVSVKDNYESIRILHKYGITASASFVIGSPDETEAEIMDTYNFIRDSKVDFADTYVLFPLPGTPVWEYAKSIGQVQDEGMDWGRLDCYYSNTKNPIVVSSHISKEKMSKIYSKFKRQRICLAARKAWFHPLFPDMIRAGLQRIKNLFVRDECRLSQSLS